jgi:hypothetical protein
MRRPLALTIAVIITLALTACGTAMQDNPGTSNAGCVDLGTTGSGYHVYDCQTTLRDTRRVNCIVVSATGVDCDWSHVDGSDNL